MEQKITSLTQELTELRTKLEDPSVFSTPEYPKLARRQKYLEDTVNLYQRIQTLEAQKSEASEYANSGDEEMAQLAQAELTDIDRQLATLNEALSEALTPKDPNDDKDVIMEIRAAAGGDESSLFGGELYRMYVRWCETHGYKTELISESPSEAGGFKEIIFTISGGDGAYRMLKFEAGVHRVQRVPVTESQGRIHTSTVTVAVMPEAEETDIEINPSDLRIDVFRAGGHGGQSVNTTDSAVRITHSHERAAFPLAASQN
jgi:peptide chain release factor 1